MVAWRRGGAFCKGIVITARRGGLPFAPAKGSKTGQRGTKLSPLQTPLTLSCGWIRTMQGIVRTAPQIRSQGACGAFYFGFCRDRIKNQPYKRRRVGRNLRLSRADPALCSGQPSPLRCILLSPQGLATLRGPRLYGAYRRVGSRGPPRVTFGYFSSQKSNPSPGRRTVCHPAVTLRRRRRDKIITFCQQPLSQSCG